MILVSTLREAISEICSNIPQIGKIKTVITDDRFVKRLAEQRLIDNTLLVIVVPSTKASKKWRKWAVIILSAVFFPR
jgi:hypothetical protein